MMRKTSYMILFGLVCLPTLSFAVKKKPPSKKKERSAAYLAKRAEKKKRWKERQERIKRKNLEKVSSMLRKWRKKEAKPVEPLRNIVLRKELLNRLTKRPINNNDEDAAVILLRSLRKKSPQIMLKKLWGSYE